MIECVENLETLKQLMKLHPDVYQQEGYTVYVESEQATYAYHDEEWVLAVAGETASATSLYDLNEAIVRSLPAFNQKDMKEAKDIINAFRASHRSRYYMMLSKKDSYYSIFTNQCEIEEFDTLGDAVLSCAQDWGSICSVCLLTDADVVEIWTHDEITDEMHYFLLFDCEQMMVTFGG